MALGKAARTLFIKKAREFSRAPREEKFRTLKAQAKKIEKRGLFGMLSDVQRQLTNALPESTNSAFQASNPSANKPARVREHFSESNTRSDSQHLKTQQLKPEPSQKTNPSKIQKVQKESISNSREPIKTRTMARVLLEQGHPRRALSILRKLVDEQPDNASLRDELQQAEQALQKDSEEDHQEDADPEQGEIVFVPLQAQQAIVAWEISEQRIQKSAQWIGHGKLTLQVVLVAPDKSALILSEVRKKTVTHQGAWWIESIPKDCQVTASIGIETQERFISLMHTQVMTASVE
jgi:predicted Zn-dependent protease